MWLPHSGRASGKTRYEPETVSSELPLDLLPDRVTVYLLCPQPSLSCHGGQQHPPTCEDEPYTPTEGSVTVTGNKGDEQSRAEHTRQPGRPSLGTLTPISCYPLLAGRQEGRPSQQGCAGGCGHMVGGGRSWETGLRELRNPPYLRPVLHLRELCLKSLDL